MARGPHIVSAPAEKCHGLQSGTLVGERPQQGDHGDGIGLGDRVWTRPELPNSGVLARLIPTIDL